MKKLVLLGLIGLAIILFFALGGPSYLSLDALKASQAQFENWRMSAPFLVALLFFTVYVAITGLSLPGAAIMTLAGGALFGFWQGLLLVSFASSIGATLAFLASRYLLRDWVNERFGARLKTINDGIERDGAFYLFTLRLVPVIPFFVINLLMGLTRIKTPTFYGVSQLGMLPGTAVYVNAGTQLGQLESLSGILSPSLLLSFALLGIFPWIARAIARFFQKRRVYANYQRPAQYDRNLIVIGGGAAGLVSAYVAAAVKAKVTLLEAHKMGGDCLNYGCVPSKALIKSAKVAHEMQHLDKYGLETAPEAAQNQAPYRVNFKAIMQRVHDVIRAIEPHDSVERYTGLGVDVQQAYARLVDPWTVEMTYPDGETKQLTARSIVIAAGASPFVPPIEGIEASDYVTSDTLWDKFAQYDTVPARLLVLGGGPIGCELAQSFARLGAQVTQVERGERLLSREDDEVVDEVTQALQQDGVRVLCEHNAIRFEQRDGEKVLIVTHQDAELALPYDEVIVAVGRAARLTGYGLEELGISTARTVQTNEYLETLYPNIYAAGDVAGPYQFTHAAGQQAWHAAVNGLFGNFKRFAVDYRVMPHGTFVDPEVARVGLNEREAKEQDVAYEVTHYGIDDLDRAIADSAARGFVKVLTVPGKDKILGVTIVGTHAADLLAEYVLAMKQRIGLNKILGTIHTYPTLSEANKYAAGEWKRAHAPEKILAWLERYHTWRRGSAIKQG